MRRNLLLTITSLLLILLLSFHLAQDALRAVPGTFEAGPGNFTVIVVLAGLLCGTLLLTGRRSGFVIQFIGALFAIGMPILHLRGRGIGPDPRPGGTFFFLWTMLALGILGILGAVLSARGLWNMKARAAKGGPPES